MHHMVIFIFIIVSVIPDAVTSDAPLTTESSTASTGRSITFCEGLQVHAQEALKQGNGERIC